MRDSNKSPKPPSIFDTIKAISSTRPLTFANLVEDNLPYDAFMINRAFSLTEDTVLAAALMNERPHLDKDMQAAFYISTLRPRRRFEKWPKSLDDPTAKTVAAYYGMSVREAKLSANLHTNEEIQEMRKVLDDGARPSRFR